MKINKITTPYAGQDELYIQALKKILAKIVPNGDDLTLERWKKLLPIIEWSKIGTSPCKLSFFLCCSSRPRVFRFFQEMISRWLVPGQWMNTTMQFAIDFTFQEDDTTLYTGAEVVLQVSTKKQLEQILKNFPIIETELRIGLGSSYQANRIMEIKGLSADEKTAMIQENIASVVKRRPQDFDYDIFSEMQHFLVLCKDEFKAARNYRHMSRIVCFHYLFRKALKHSLEAFPNRRFVSLKLLRVTISSHRGTKQRVLGLVIGLSFLQENELFEERHALKAIEAFIPNVKGVPGSLFINASKADPTRLIYLEVEKVNQAPFTLEETGLLKMELPDELNHCIEERYNPIFMPRNEEEILRHILVLSNQLKFVRDYPQAVILFEKQTGGALEFLVVLVRLVKKGHLPIQDYFEMKPTYLQFLPDRIRDVGHLRKKYRKEANVFRVQVRKDQYLRQDHSVDLYKARLEVASELAHVIGEFRDYNGGTISKENEIFAALCKSLEHTGKEHTFLLENFFYSLYPALMRSIMKPQLLKELFLMILEEVERGLSSGQTIFFRVKEEADKILIVIVSEDPYFRREVQKAVDLIGTIETPIATCFVAHNMIFCMGIIANLTEPRNVRHLRLAIEEALHAVVS
ncbi:MAG: hypothetical protein KDK55_02435 [Chlamydiia bacterium]|nr:hypothetical protein [Chlamydiia bacterium]